MAQPRESRHVVISAQEMKDFLHSNFDGWHHTIANGMGISKTVLAVVPSWSRSCGSVIKKTIAEHDALHIDDRACREADPYTEFVYLLHNRGLTLQSRPDHMVLTRQLTFLVKGSVATHAASTCDLEGYACVTEAFRVVEASAMQDLARELERLRGTDRLCSTCLDLCPGVPRRGVQGHAQHKVMFYFILAKKTLQRGHRRQPPPLGRRPAHGLHRRRGQVPLPTSRQEAGRNYSESIRSLLTSPLHLCTDPHRACPRPFLQRFAQFCMLLFRRHKHHISRPERHFFVNFSKHKLSSVHRRPVTAHFGTSFHSSTITLPASSVRQPCFLKAVKIA